MHLSFAATINKYNDDLELNRWLFILSLSLAAQTGSIAHEIREGVLPTRITFELLVGIISLGAWWRRG